MAKQTWKQAYERKPLTRDLIVLRILDPRRSNLGSVGVALVKAAKRA